MNFALHHENRYGRRNHCQSVCILSGSICQQEDTAKANFVLAWYRIMNLLNHVFIP